MVDPENNEWFKAITLTGRVRAKCGFCAALNTVLTEAQYKLGEFRGLHSLLRHIQIYSILMVT